MGPRNAEGRRVCGPWSIRILRGILVVEDGFGGDIAEEGSEEGNVVKLADWIREIYFGIECPSGIGTVLKK